MNISLSDHFDYKRLIRFTLPTIFMMIVTSIYGAVDGLFISNVVGSEAFAAVNLIMPVIMIPGTIGFMIGTGGSALVSMTLGQQDTKRANEYFSMFIYLLAIIGTALAIIGVPLLKPIAGLLGATESMVPLCVTYGSILMCALPIYMLLNSFQSFLVVAEKPGLGLVVSVISGVTNIFLDFLFVVVFRYGVVGAAVATALSQAVGVVIPIFYFLRKEAPIHFVRTRFNLTAIKKACFNGSSEMVTNVAMSLVSMLYNWQLMKIAGQNGVVAYGVIMYTGFLFSGTYMGYSVGAAPVIGYNYGAANHEELRNVLKRSLKLLIVTAIVMTGLAEITAGLQARIFVSYDRELMEFTIKAIRLYSLSYLISEINIFASSFFTALNNGVISALISFLRTFVFLVIAILTAPILFGVNGIWLAVVFAEICALCISIWCIGKNWAKYGNTNGAYQEKEGEILAKEM